MPWYEASAYVLSIVSALVAGGLLWFLCSRLLSPRFRVSGVVSAAGLCAARFLISEFLTQDPYDERQLIRFVVLIGVSATLVWLFWRGQPSLQGYVVCVHNALFETCFFLAYCGQHVLSTLLGAHIDHLFELHRDPASVLAYAEFTVTALNIASVVLTTYLVWVFAKSLAKSLPTIPDLRPPEIRLILFPAAASMFICLLVRLMLFSMEDGIPVSVFERIPAMFVLTPCIMLLLLGTIVFSVRTLRNMRELAQQNSERIVLAEQIRLLEDQVTLTKRQNEIVRRMRHDLMNTISVVDHLSKNDPAGLEEYLSRLKDDARSAAPSYITGSSVTDALFSIKARKLSDTVPQGHLEVARFQLPDLWRPAAYDLGIIVSNALDNAIEGTARFHERNPEAACCVTVSAFAEREMLFLRIENPCVLADKPSGSPFPVTTKTGDQHGLGLRNILAVAQKHGGTVDYEISGGTFTLSVMLARPRCSGAA